MDDNKTRGCTLPDVIYLPGVVETADAHVPMVDAVSLHMENGYKQGEQRILDKLREAVNEECSCGGCGPDDPQACQACMVWHRVTGGEG